MSDLSHDWGPDKWGHGRRCRNCTRLEHHEDSPAICIIKVQEHIQELENPWISVEDRLPEPATSVFARGMGGRHYVGCYIDACWATTEGLPDSITHWMPIPEIESMNIHELNDLIGDDAIKDAIKTGTGFTRTQVVDGELTTERVSPDDVYKSSGQYQLWGDDYASDGVWLRVKIAEGNLKHCREAMDNRENKLVYRDMEIRRGQKQKSPDEGA